MNKLLLAIFFLVTLATQVFAQDISGLEKIGSVTSFTKNEKSVTLDCQDNSQVQLTVLAPDLIRVRVSFAKPIPARDHSWAIAKNDWNIARWEVRETADTISLSTGEVEVNVRRSPLLVEFRDARTHDLINADQQPMAYDARGAVKGMMFDSAAGQF